MQNPTQATCSKAKDQHTLPPFHHLSGSTDATQTLVSLVKEQKIGVIGQRFKSAVLDGSNEAAIVQDNNHQANGNYHHDLEAHSEGATNPQKEILKPKSEVSDSSSELNSLASSSDEDEISRVVEGGEERRLSPRRNTVNHPHLALRPSHKQESTPSYIFSAASDLESFKVGMGRRTTSKVSPMKKRLESGLLCIDTSSQAPSNLDFAINLLGDEDDSEKEKRITSFLDKLEIHQIDFKEFLTSSNKYAKPPSNDVLDTFSFDASFKAASRTQSRSSSLFQRRMQMNKESDNKLKNLNFAALRLRGLEIKKDPSPTKQAPSDSSDSILGRESTVVAAGETDLWTPCEEAGSRKLSIKLHCQTPTIVEQADEEGTHR